MVDDPGTADLTHLGGYIPGGDPNTYDPVVWDELIASFCIKRMIDVGCGEGHSVRYFLERGVSAYGIEGCADAIGSSPVPHRIICHDYTQGPYRPAEFFDLAWSCEFVEHVEERYVPNFLATFAACRFVAMTHAVPGQSGYHHVNCQTSDYWIRRLSEVGFQLRHLESDGIRQIATTPYIRRTLLLFSAQSET